MLNELEAKYAALFREASDARDTTRCLLLNDQLTDELALRPPSVSEVAAAFNELYETGRSRFETVLMRAAWSNLSPEYGPVLCQILANPNCRDFHEQVIELLEEVGDERAIPALSKALAYRWDYDPWLLVPKKSLRALASLGSPKADAVLKASLQSVDEPIREEAALLLGVE